MILLPLLAALLTPDQKEMAWNVYQIWGRYRFNSLKVCRCAFILNKIENESVYYVAIATPVVRSLD